MTQHTSDLAKPLTRRLAENPDRRGGPMAVSLLLHVLLVWLAISLTRVDIETGTGALGPPGTGGGGGGGEVVHVISMPGEPPPPPQVQPPVLPEPEEDEIVVPEPIPVPEIEVVATVDSVPPPPNLIPELTTVGTGVGGGAPELGRGGGPGSGGGSGGGTGGGDGPGTGGGSGPGTGGGDGTLGRAPSPLMLLFPPPAPRSMRGRSVTVHLVVDAQGVVRQVELDPETGNGDVDRDIRRAAMEWRFRPGTDGSGAFVTKPFDVVLTF